MFRLWAAFALVNVVLVAGAFAGAETYIRYARTKQVSYSDMTELPMCVPDDKLVWRFRPFVDEVVRAPEFTITVKTNKDGLRGPDLDRVEGDFVILVVGDSITFGYGVEEEQRFSELIADQIRGERPDLHVKMVNAGAWMYTYDQQLLMMKELILRLQPNIIVHGVSWVHVRTLFAHRWHYDWSGELDAVSDPGISIKPDGVLRFRSDWLERPPLGSQLLAEAVRFVLNRELVAKALDYMTLMDPDEHANDWLWRRTDELLTETAMTAKRSGAVYVPYLTPANVQVSDMYWGGVVPKATWDREYPTERMMSIFAKAGVTPVNLLHAFRARFSPNLYYDKDPHWRSAGHALAAQAILERLRQYFPSRPQASSK
jgi:hypothetical protein